MTIDLPVIWFAIIVFATLMYIVMDGFDLGVGILFPFIRDKHDRDVMVNSSRRYGTGTKPGWCWAAPGFLARSRWLMPSSPTR